MKKLLSKLSVFEIVAYSILILMGLWGLVYTSLGIASEFIYYKSGVYQANQTLKSTFGGIGFLWGGLIVLGATAAVSVTILCINAKQSDRDFEKAQRRKARLKKNVTPEVVDAEVEPVVEK